MEISVLITLFNRVEYIESCIRSVYASDFEGYEVIVLDDKSTDGSFEKVKELQTEFRDLKVFQNKENLGQFPNRNAIVALAEGKYIKFIDSDDLLYSHTLKIMHNFISEHPSAGAAVQDPFAKNSKKYPLFLGSKEAFKYNFFTNNIFLGGPSGSIIRRDVFFDLGGYKTDLLLEDNLFWVRIAEKMPIVILPSCLVYWREHANQEFSKWGTVDQNIHYLYFGYFSLERGRKFLTQQEQNIVKNQLRNWCIGKLLNALMKFRIRELFQWISHCWIKRNKYEKMYGINSR